MSFKRDKTTRPKVRDKDMLGRPFVITPCLLDSIENIYEDKSSISKLSYDATGKLVVYLFNAGNITKVHYNESGFIDVVKNYAGCSNIRLFYTDNGLIDKLIVAGGDMPGKIQVSIDDNKTVKCSRYDYADNLLDVFTHEFDENYNLVKTTVEWSNGGDLELSKTATFNYDVTTLNPFHSLGDFRNIILLINNDEFLVEGTYLMGSKNFITGTVINDTEEPGFTGNELTKIIEANSTGYPLQLCFRETDGGCINKYIYHYQCR